MVSRSLLVVGYCYLVLFSCGLLASGRALNNVDSNSTFFASMEMPSFNAATSSMDSDCTFSEPTKDHESKHSVVLNLKHRSSSISGKQAKPKDSVARSTAKDLARIQTLHRRIVESSNKNQNLISRLAGNNDDDDNHKPYKKTTTISPAASPEPYVGGPSAHLVATLESGVSLGSGEYFMDVFIGTPPKHFSLILDTGSDLNWIQCLPCNDCFEQHGPYYDPEESTSYRNISCFDPRCRLVSSPKPHQACKNENQSCPYYYWYGDSSNTTGDFALETFTVNLTTDDRKPAQFKTVENVMFGCGHWNRGLFHGAAGLLGLGRGPLSFSSQLKSLYGESFSYCLVDRNSDSSVTSKLIFGEDRDLLERKELNFTSIVSGKENPVDTFYYVQIKSILVGNEGLNIPEETWSFTSDGSGGTIIDSGTTLSYFADPAYEIVKEAFVRKVTKYPKVEGFPILDPCYNVSGSGKKLDLPSFGIVFGDGAVWNFPLENYFIKFEGEDIVCLAILGTPRSALSIIGNYQQQNFHVLYDTKRSRLGYVPRNCADM